MRRWQRLGLRFKLVLGINLTMFLILGSAFVGISRYIRAQLWQREVQAAENLNAMAATLLQDAMMAGHKERFQEALLRLGQSVEGQIDDIAVYDDQAVLTSFVSGFPGGRTIQRESLEEDIRDPTCWVCHRLPAEERPAMTIVSLEGEEVLRNVVPLYNEPRCQACHGIGKKVLGDSIVDFRLDRYQQVSRAVTLRLAGGVTLAVALVAVVLYLLLHRIVLSPLGELVVVTQAVEQGDLNRQVMVRSRDEVGQAGAAFNNMINQLRDLIGSLEQRVVERTRELEQRSAYLEASAEAGRTVTSILDPDTLIQQVVELIRDRFDLYYVGLFLVDQRNEWAVLRAGTGDAGRAMLAREHRLRVGEGMIGWSIANAEARVALDAGEDAVRFDNPDLPGTRSEAALPLRSRGRVLGALSVQHTQPSAFDTDTIAVLQIMADQVSVALDNARLFAASQAALEATRRAYGEMSHRAWTEVLRSRTDWGYRYAHQSVSQIERDWRSDTLDAEQTDQSGQEDGDVGETLVVPLRVRDQRVGMLSFRKDERGETWTAEEAAWLETLTDQLGLALESARLYQDTQRRVAREQLIGHVTARMRETLNVETVLKTAAQEVRQALGLPEVIVRLTPQSNNQARDRMSGDT